MTRPAAGTFRVVAEPRVARLTAAKIWQAIAERQTATAKRCELYGDLSGAAMFGQRARRAGQMATAMLARLDDDGAPQQRGLRTA